MVDTFRGKLRVRKWPEKRGTPKSAAVRTLNRWFKEVNRLAKLSDPAQQLVAMDVTKGSGLYPRDLLVRAMSSGLFDVIFPDGQALEYQPLTMEPRMFAGAILNLAANFALPSPATTAVPFPLPVRDTFGFWNVANPTRLTIPGGIDVVELHGGIMTTGAPSNQNSASHFYRNGVLMKRQAALYQGTTGQTVSSGPLMVVAGDFFELRITASSPRTLLAGEVTFFSLNVLGTTP